MPALESRMRNRSLSFIRKSIKLRNFQDGNSSSLWEILMLNLAREVKHSTSVQLDVESEEVKITEESKLVITNTFFQSLRKLYTWHRPTRENYYKSNRQHFNVQEVLKQLHIRQMGEFRDKLMEIQKRKSQSYYVQGLKDLDTNGDSYHAERTKCSWQRWDELRTEHQINYTNISRDKGEKSCLTD